jgi:hypothetical protein
MWISVNWFWDHVDLSKLVLRPWGGLSKLVSNSIYVTGSSHPLRPGGVVGVGGGTLVHFTYTNTVIKNMYAVKTHWLFL